MKAGKLGGVTPKKLSVSVFPYLQKCIELDPKRTPLPGKTSNRALSI